MVSFLNKNSDVMSRNYKSIFEKQRNLYQKSMVQQSPYLLPTGEKKFIHNTSQLGMIRNSMIHSKEIDSRNNSLLASINTPIHNKYLSNSEKLMISNNKKLSNVPNSSSNLNFKPQFANVQNIPHMSSITRSKNISGVSAINFNPMNNLREPNGQLRQGVNTMIGNKYWGAMDSVPNMKHSQPVNYLPHNSVANPLNNYQNQIYKQNKLFPANTLPNDRINTKK